MTETQLGIGRKISFCAMLCTYKNNVASEIELALNSAFVEQSYPPAELIVVKDGPIPDDVANVIGDFEEKFPIRYVVFPECRGHGPARSAAIEICDHDWIAIIDADDISAPDRFESLLAVISEYPKTAVVGGGLTEFSENKGTLEYGATVFYPERPEEVKQYIGSRSPVAQPTSILRVEAIRAVGGYQEWFNNEDYHLWIRLIAAGYDIRNVPKSLLDFRVDPSLYRRRGGVIYWWNEVKLQIYSYRLGCTTFGKLITGALVRFAVQVLMPGRIRQAFYQRVLRKT